MDRRHDNCMPKALREKKNIGSLSINKERELTKLKSNATPFFSFSLFLPPPFFPSFLLSLSSPPPLCFLSLLPFPTLSLYLSLILAILPETCRFFHYIQFVSQNVFPFQSSIAPEPVFGLSSAQCYLPSIILSIMNRHLIHYLPCRHSDAFIISTEGNV